MESKSVMLDLTQQKQATLPNRQKLMAKAMAANIRSFWIIVALCGITLLSILFAWKESNRADSNIKVVWLKMYPNGTWDMDFSDNERGPDFFQSTVDYILRQWVERRFSEVPHSIQSDYGFVYLFMSKKLQGEFISPNGDDAPTKAAKIAECASCGEVHVNVRNIDHYDSDKTVFGKHNGVLYRSNVFIQRNTHNADGNPNGNPEKLIVSLQWRIKSTEEIQAEKGILNQNPIGLEIISYELLKDVS